MSATATLGVPPNAAYIDRDGDLHLNGAKVYNDAEADISDSLEQLNALAPAELAFLDGVTAGTAAASKAVVLDANLDISTIRHLTINGNLVTGATTLAESDLAKIDGITNGTAAASKALVLDASSDITGIRHATLTGLVKHSVASPAAAGSLTSDATVLAADVNGVTGADGTTGVKLPSGGGIRMAVVNTHATNTLKVYPPTGGTINGAGADAAYSLLGGRRAFFAATAAGTYLAFEAPDSTAPAAVAAGYKIARGETALDGGNPTSVAHGLTTCIAFTATLVGTAAPALSTSVLTANINGANVDVYAWKPTGAGDTTLTASTGTESFYWIAIGT